jgi:hypothetical protein
LIDLVRTSRSVTQRPSWWRRCAVRRRAVLVALVMTLAAAACASDQAALADESNDYRQQLVTLAQRCNDLGLDEQASITRAWWLNRDARRYYLFIPPETDPVRPADDAPVNVHFWYKRFSQFRQQQAERLFKLARQACEAGDESRAYCLLHEVLHEDPDHAEARRILDYIRTDRGWRPARRGPMAVKPKKFHWQDARHWTVDVGHFRVTTNADRAVAEQAARFLEDVYIVWRQLFYNCWSIPDRLSDRFQGRPVSLAPDRKFQIVLFRDREDYVQQLRPFEPQIEMTTGYYAQGGHVSFFIVGDASSRRNWVHEVTHQFFQESISRVPQVGETSNFWVVEAAALYMESFTRQTGYATTGGADSRRLQYARHRFLNQGFPVALPELVALGREQFQQRDDIRQIYSYAAGLAHLLMHYRQGAWKPPFVDYLKDVYRGQADQNAFTERFGDIDDQLEAAFREFLEFTDTDLKFVNRDCRELCLSHTSVTDDGLRALEDCDQLRWLDLSYTLVSDAGLAYLAQATQLRQLDLERTRISDAAMNTISRFHQLEELDLSYTNVGNASLKTLGNLLSLEVLGLTRTRISDEGLSDLKSLRNLEQLNLQGTAVTTDAVDQLREVLPKW